MPKTTTYYKFEDPTLFSFNGTEEQRQELRDMEDQFRSLGELLRNPPVPKPGQTPHEAMMQSPFFSDKEIYGIE